MRKIQKMRRRYIQVVDMHFDDEGVCYGYFFWKVDVWVRVGRDESETVLLAGILAVHCARIGEKIGGTIVQEEVGRQW